MEIRLRIQKATHAQRFRIRRTACSRLVSPVFLLVSITQRSASDRKASIPPCPETLASRWNNLEEAGTEGREFRVEEALPLDKLPVAQLHRSRRSHSGQVHLDRLGLLLEVEDNHDTLRRVGRRAQVHRLRRRTEGGTQYPEPNTAYSLTWER